MALGDRPRRLGSLAFCSTGIYIYMDSHNEDIRSASHSPNGEFMKCDTLYFSCLLAAGVLTTLTANLRARYCVKRHIIPDPNANLNSNLNTNP